MKIHTGDRIKEIMYEKGLKQVDILNAAKKFEPELGIKLTKSVLSQYINKKSEPMQDKIFLLAKILDVDEAWLMGFNVPRTRKYHPPNNSKNYEFSLSNKLVSSINESPALSNYIEPPKKRVYREAVKGHDSLNSSSLIPTESYFPVVPYYNDIDFDSFLENSPVQSFEFIPEKLLKTYPKSFYVKVRNNFIEKVIKKDSKALISPSEEYKSFVDIVAVIKKNQGIVLGRYYRSEDSAHIYPESYNDGIMPIVIMHKNVIGEDIKILGKLVWYMPPFRQNF